MATHGQKLLAAGTAALIAEPVLALAHMGGVGVIVGLAVGAAAYVAVEDVERVTGRELPLPAPRNERADAENGTPRHSFAYRLLNGKSMRGEVDDTPHQSTDPDRGQPEAETFAEDSADPLMDFGPTLQPTVNSILSGRKVVIGVSDAGKSNAVAVIAEEIGGPAYGAPLFLLDTEDEYRKLNDKRYLSKPLWMDRSKLTPDNAFEFAQWAVATMRQVIINLQSYEDAEAAWVMIGLIKGVQAYQETHDVRVPCEFILDEATVWLPQVRSQSTLAKIMVEDPDGIGDEDDTDEEDEQEKGKDRSNQISLLSLLERAFFSVVVRRGRKRGMGFTLACQRIAEINKSALQANWTFLMRQTQAADFRLYKHFGIEAKEAMELRAGDAFVFPPGKPMERHRFRLRRSPHGAKTPGLEELRTHQQRLASSPSAEAPLPRLPEQRVRSTATKEGARSLYAVPRANEEGTLQEDALRSQPRPPFTLVPAEESGGEEGEEVSETDQDEDLNEREQLYMKALDAWANNARSIRKIQEALDLGFNEARELLEEMHGLGLIVWQRKGEKAGV